jgi:hypothetical protein
MEAATAPPKPEKRGPDGAKAGKEVITGSEKHAFNADQRAKEREAAEITIGGEVWHRRKKNWKVTRDLRGIMREQERAQTRIARAAKALDELPIDTDDDEIESWNVKIDEGQDDADRAAFKIIALLLRDDEGASPTIEHLQEHLDVEDAGMLAQTLSGGGEQDVPPTSETTESS